MISSRQADPRPLLQHDQPQPTTISTNINNIFAGLTFPEVPKNPIINTRGNISRTTAIEDYVALSAHSEHHEAFEEKKPLADLDARDNTLPWSYQPTKNNITSSSQTVAATTDFISGLDLNGISSLNLPTIMNSNTKSKLSGLYSSELTATTGLYPSLPDITTTNNIMPPAPAVLKKSPYDILTANNNYSSISNYYEDPTSTIQESSSLYPSLPPIDDVMLASQEKIAKPIKNGTLPTTAVEDPNQIYNDLLNENERLQLQLENLQKSMSTAQPATTNINTINSNIRSNISPLSATSTTTATVEVDARVDLHPTTTTSTTTTTTTTTNNQMNSSSTDLPLPVAVSKFVCCGKCKQWLQSPKEAVYVYCPKCEAINDCGLVPESKLTAATPPPAESKPARTPARR